MLTPQDVQDKKFEKAVFGGYDTGSVDDFLETLSADYAALYKENAILKSKMKVLVDKVEEYRSTEDAMRVALKTAQKLSDDMIADAKAKSENIIEEAEKNAADRKAEINRSVQVEEKRLDAAKGRTAEFVDVAGALCNKYMEFLGKLGELQPEISEPEPEPISEEERISETAKDIEDSISRIIDGEVSSAEPEAAPADEKDDKEFDTKSFDPITKQADKYEVDEPTSPRPKFDFKDLQFGSNYDNKGK